MTALRVTRTVAVGSATVLTLAMMIAAVTSGVDIGLCGKTVAADVQLTRDLFCSANGINVGATGITIDLNGHTIHGLGLGGATAGIVITNQADVTIRGSGTITGFTTGIAISGSSNIVVGGVDVVGNGLSGLVTLRGGIRIMSSTNVQLYENRIDGNGVGVALAGTSPGGTIYDNKIKDNGIGMRFVLTVTGYTVAANKITKSDCGVQGITTGNAFIDNKFANNIADTC